MISRRNIRVKVMQTLYSLETMTNGTDTGDGLKKSTPHQMLQKHLEQTQEIFTYLLYHTVQVALYAEKDAQIKSSKHLPTEKDLHVNTKIAGNPFVWQLMEDEGFQHKVKEWNLREYLDPELIKKCYLQLIDTEDYQAYIASPERNKTTERKILLYIFNDLLMKNELFDQHMEDLFMHWCDDKEMMLVLVNNYFQKPVLFNFIQLISKEKWDYARDLLQTVQDKKEYCLEQIRPKLQNWDPDRIAAIDMLLMQMGVCEFLYFPTIPTKVTINEYIDLAKSYSTPQSGQFVNGILDNILKELEAAQRIHKTDRARK